MEGVDSPLEVLSLAATMVQGSCLPPSYEEARKSLPSVRWRRDRRARDSLPDYAATSQPRDADGPLDMSTRSRASARGAERAERAATRSKLGLLPAANSNPKPGTTPPSTPPPGRTPPPSYSEAISKPGYRMPPARPSVITCAPPSPTLIKETDKLATDNGGDGMCDPVIDEHFRRSLGKDYLTLFKKNTSKSSSLSEEEENTGLSVDDHFAKALGDTWVKLQKESTSSSITPVPSKPTSKDSSSNSIPRPRRGLVTI